MANKSGTRQYLLVPFLLSLVCTEIALAADDPVDPVKEVHELTMQWTGLEHQKDTLLSNWRKQQPVLEQQQLLLERESEELQALIDESSQQQDEVEQRRLELLGQQGQYEQEQESLQRALSQATLRIKGMHPRLPPPLHDSWSQDLAELEGELLNDSEKLRLLLELLGQLDDFQQKVTLHETVMTLENGQEYLVNQVYLGVSRGWYVTADRVYAARGNAGMDGWQWSPIDDADEVARMIGILQRTENPALISLPVTDIRTAGEQ